MTRGKQRIRYNIQDLQPYFHQTLTTAAKELGICPATLKRACRRIGIEKWPYRQVKSSLRQVDRGRKRYARAMASIRTKEEKPKTTFEKENEERAARSLRKWYVDVLGINPNVKIVSME